jgi:peptide/nickel transport system permease protein
MHLLRQIYRSIVGDRMALFGLAVLVMFSIMAVFAPEIAPFDPQEIIMDPETGQAVKYHPPSGRYLFGTNNLARDVFSQVVHGTRIALAVSFVSALVVTVVGTTVGLLAGYYRGWLDDLLMRIVDVAYGIPFVPFAILLVGLMRPSTANIILAMALLMWRGGGGVGGGGGGGGGEET